MDRKLEIFENVLTNSFSNDLFTNFVREFLNNLEMVAPTRYNKEYSNFSFYVDGYYHIGNYVSDEGDKIAVFSVCLNKGDTVERARGIQRNFVKPLIERGNCAGALVAFYTKDEPDKWRLSFIRMDYEFSKGKVTEKLTPAKRYSYLVGKGEPCHTAKQRLYPIFVNDDRNPGIDELEEAFSVEKVTKEFFDLYCEKYHQLREYLESNEDFMIEAQIRSFTSEQFAKKLLGQIVFLYFIQKKGWLGVDAIPVILTDKAYKNAFFSRGTKSREMMGMIYAQQSDGSYRIILEKLQKLSDEDEEFLAGIVKGKPWGSGPKDFMRKIYNGCITTGKNYFNDYLEPLFYTGLNKNRGENGFYAPLHRRVPFLNGGLFEQLDNYEWENNNFNIPNNLFSNIDVKGIRDADGILDIFDRYNFTMNEDEPMEREVAIDPEMLGKVFENLLDVKDRKSKGAFYTPREIVHYMCQESLINHLKNKTNLIESDIRDFILYGDLMKDEDTTIDAREGNKDMLISANILSLKTGVNRLKELDNILANVKVADLAVGSGAFPLGMLNEIVKARETLSAYMSIGMNAFQKKSFYAYDRKPYDLKVNTIKNCIFACDIEPSAIDIAKLRLWLSIVIDDEIVDDAGNGEFDAHSKPRQLPNLDCNIICGNSLINEFKGIKLINESDLLHNISNNSQISMYQGGVDSLLAEIIRLQDKLFFTKEHEEKEEIKQNIHNIYNLIIQEQLHGDQNLLDGYYETLNESSKPFILWQLYFPGVFRDNGGFDIVIGNPPYIKIQNIDTEQSEILKKNYRTATGKFDIYVLFVEKAFELLASNGICGYIHPHRFLNVGYGSGIREYLLEHKGLAKFVHFGVNQVFDSATTYTGIFFYVNNSEKILYTEAESNDLNSLVFFEKNWNELGNTWSFTDDNKSSVVSKICNNDVSLLDIFEGIYQGLITLGDEKFIMEGRIVGDYFYGYSKEIKQEVKLEAEIMKPLLKGENIRRYSQPNSEMYVIYPHVINDKGKTIPLEEDQLIDKYPRAYEYLLQFKDELLIKKVKYKTNPKYWYSLHRSRERRIMESEKIITPQLQNYCNFAYDAKGMFPDAGGYMLIIRDSYKHELLYYYGILNSSLFYHFIKSTSTAFNNNYYYFKTAYIEPFKFPETVQDSMKHEIIKSVEEILRLRNEDISNDISALEKKVDNIVYQIYGLSDDEINDIEAKYNVQ